MYNFRNDWLKEPKNRKDIIFNWIHMNEEQQSYFDFDPNNYGYMVMVKFFDITDDEIRSAIDDYFSIG